MNVGSRLGWAIQPWDDASLVPHVVYGGRPFKKCWNWVFRRLQS
jgi:hypothetical protein